MEFLRCLPMKVRVAAVFVAVGTIWGSAWIPSSALSQTLPGLAVGALRFALAALVLGLVAFFAGRRTSAVKRSWDRDLLLAACILGVSMLAGPYALTLWTAKQVAPGVVALVFGFTPLLVLFVENDDRTGEAGRSAIPAVILGIGGVAMLLARGLSINWQQAAGIAGLLAAMALSSVSLIYMRRLRIQNRLSNRQLPGFAAIQFGVASVLLAALSLATGERRYFAWDRQAALPLAVLGIVVSTASLPALYWLLSYMTAWQAGTLQWASTLIAVAEAAWISGGRPSAIEWIGAILVPACILQIFLGTSGQGPVTVTPQITEHTFPHRDASDIRGKTG